MRVKRYIAKDGSGDVKIIADNTEDMWHVYNLIAVGDLVRASTVRKVTLAGRIVCCRGQVFPPQVIRESSSGTVMSDRMTLTLTLEVRNPPLLPFSLRSGASVQVVGFTYDAKGGTIRISGKNKEENEFVKVISLRWPL